MSPRQHVLEPGCLDMTCDRKYYRRGTAFIKRTLRPKEYRTAFFGLHIPRRIQECLINEAASLRYIRQHTDVPVPAVHCDFEDDGAYYLVTEYVEGVPMSHLSAEKQAVVRLELEDHIATLKNMTSNRLGGPSGLVVPPIRVMHRTETDNWSLVPSDRHEFVFCHNDLSQKKVLVNPDTLKINAIIDWEYAGFYPAQFEWPFYTRPGPASMLPGEYDDSAELLAYLNSKVQQT